MCVRRNSMSFNAESSRLYFALLKASSCDYSSYTHTKKNPRVQTLNMCQALEFQIATLTSIMDRVVWCFLICILDFCVTFPAIKMVSVWYGLLAAHFTFTVWILHRNIFTEDKKNLSQKYYSKILCIETIPEQISFDTYKLTKRVFN